MKFFLKEKLSLSKEYENLLFVIFASGFLILAFLLYGKFPVNDDSFIYLQYVKNIISSGEISFNKGEISYGFTSPLWLAILLFFDLIGFGGEKYIYLPSAIISLLYFFIWYKILNKTDELKKFRYFYFWLILLDPNLIKHFNSGMETTLIMFLTGLQIFIYLSITKKDNEINKKLFFLVQAISFLTRPESILLTITFNLILLIEKTFSYKDVFNFILIFILIVFPWHIFAFLYFGTALPYTFYAKGGSYPFGTRFFIHLSDSILIFIKNYIPVISGMIILYACSLRKRSEKLQDSKPLTLLSFLLMLIYIIYYSLTQSNEYVYARYYCVIFPIMFYSVIFFFNKYSEMKYFKPVLFLTISGLLFINLLQATFKYNTEWKYDYIENEIIKWVNQNTEKNSKIVRGRIGKIKYYTERTIIDPVGLINPEISEYRIKGITEEFYKKKKAEYFIGNFKELTEKYNADFKLIKKIENEDTKRFFGIIQDRFSQTEYIYKVTWNE